MALEEYLDGVYYDHSAGEYCRIVETSDSIGLKRPEAAANSKPYFTFDEEGKSREEALEALETDFTELPEQAVENPSVFINSVLDVVEAGDTDTLADIMFLGLEYARSQVVFEEV